MTPSEIKDIIIIELNEFNDDLLQIATNELKLPALSKVANMARTQYRTPDRYNSGYLEPWVQWVSVHSATPSKSHQVKHLGDVPDLQFEQFWQILSRHQHRCGVWGVMNGAKQNAQHVPFFLPDPWTFTESAYPSELNHLLKLPRYISKNYQELKKTKLLGEGLKLIYFMLKSGQFGKISKEIIQLLKDLKTYGSHHYIFIGFFETISCLIFSQYQKKYKPQCALLFINLLAHLQHHYWSKGPSELTPELIFGFKMIDRIFGHLFDLFPNHAFVIHNGLTQMNTNHEKPWVLYRQKNPEMFLKNLKIPVTKVEAHMTHDAHLFFANSHDCEQTFDILKNARIFSKAMFHVEKNKYDPCKLFYHLVFTDKVEGSADISFDINGQTYKFFEHFDSIVTRTGRHLPLGTIYSDTIEFENHMYNHEFNRYVFHYLMPEEFELHEEEVESFEEFSLEEI